MTSIQDLLLTGFLSILTGFVWSVVGAIKRYLLAKGGEKAVKIVEIIAKNVVAAVEQMTKDETIKGQEKLDTAVLLAQAELGKYQLYLTEQELKVFLESAVKQMNEAWRANNEPVQ